MGAWRWREKWREVKVEEKCLKRVEKLMRRRVKKARSMRKRMRHREEVLKEEVLMYRNRHNNLKGEELGYRGMLRLQGFWLMVKLIVPFFASFPKSA